MEERLDPAERATDASRRAAAWARPLVPATLVAGYLVAVAAVTLLFAGSTPHWPLVLAAFGAAAYMALYIGANDVANSMGSVVGGRALPLGAALALAAAAEIAGALLAGDDVVRTLSRDIVRPVAGPDVPPIAAVMLSGSIAAASWVHLATRLGLPVSTTHSIVGGVLGATAAAGAAAIDWTTIGWIAASWIVSPVLAGTVAAALLWAIEASILGRADRVAAGRAWIPRLVALLVGVFVAYLLLQGLRNVWTAPAWLFAVLCPLGALAGWAASTRRVRRAASGLANRREPVARLFTVPLVVAAVLLAFAHGANDLANAIGPATAALAALEPGATGPVDPRLATLLLLIGAAGIATGLFRSGFRVIRTVGTRITRLDPSRAFCVALATAVTVLSATALGLPVSSTQIAVGAVFGVGFLREALTNRGVPNPAVQPRTRFLDVRALNRTPEEAVARMHRRERRRLVRRGYVVTIGAAWVATLPLCGAMAALLYGATRLVTPG